MGLTTSLAQSHEGLADYSPADRVIKRQAAIGSNQQTDQQTKWKRKKQNKAAVLGGGLKKRKVPCVCCWYRGAADAEIKVHSLKKKILSKVLSGLKTWNRSERSLHAAPAMTTIPVYSVLYQRSRMLADF